MLAQRIGRTKIIFILYIPTENPLVMYFNSNKKYLEGKNYTH